MAETVERLVGNVLVAQSGGPTVVVNASLAGTIQEAGKHPDEIEEIYGGLNGIKGLLNEELIDLQEEKSNTIESLKHTPGAALGTCRYKIAFDQDPAAAAADLQRLFEVFQAHNIRYFFYVGGNDSQDTSLKIQQEAEKRGWQMRIIGIPKTIDNDIPRTDHCPGYGSVIKYNATTVLEIARDVSSMATEEGSCCVIEVMGREAGWIAAGTVLARRAADEGPHIILLPEIPFKEVEFLERVKDVTAQCGCAVVVVGEGLKDETGVELGADQSQKDAFGHPLLSGAGERVASLVQNRLGLKTRSVKLGYAQRAAAHFGSATDVAEAVACGEGAVRAAIAGKSGYMVKLVRQQNDPYEWTTDIEPLPDVANAVNVIPRDWITEDGFLPNERFIEYARPLIQGELNLPMEGGLPKFVALDKIRLDKKLPPWEKPAPAPPQTPEP
jgi:6-phosphofructokinase 1